MYVKAWAATNRETQDVNGTIPMERGTTMNAQTDTQTKDHALANELMAHHAVMVDQLDKLTNDLLNANRIGPDAKEALIDWVHGTLLPHAAEEEATTYAAAAALPQGAALIDSMAREHQTIIALAGAFHSAEDPALAAGYARSLYTVFEAHQSKENEIVIPMLLDAGISLTEAMANAPEGHGHHH